MDTATFQRILSGFLLAIIFLLPVKTSSFSSSLSFSDNLPKSVYLNASGFLNMPHIWQLKSNSGLSFQTCSNGKLLHQVGATGDSLTLTLTNGVLNLQWQINSSFSNVTVGQNLNDNAWYFVMFEFLLGNLSVKVKKGSQLLFLKLIANETLNKDLWNVKLENGSALLVGSNFTGCLMSGPNIDLAAAYNITGLVHEGCPQTEDIACSETKKDFNDCYSYPCQNGGTCVDQDQNYTCSCLPTFTGRNCQLDLGDQKCALMPCLNNGTCENTTSSFKCFCLPGFTGDYCNHNINECETRPCVHGKCIDGINSYTCNCSGSGYKGQNCSTNVDECKELLEPCGGHKCVDTHGSYTCECPVGSAGKLCEDIDECLSQPCLNDGICKNLVNNYECNCTKGFKGSRCQTNINDCSTSSCPWNNTICRDGINKFTCECKPGFYGLIDNCQDIDECLKNPCKNNATCINLENWFLCDCISGFDGDLCDNNIDDCTLAPCQNNATCKDGVNSYTCDCAGGFQGKNCSTNIDDCLNNTCQNGATCHDHIQNYTCDCTPGWTGFRCEKDFDECSLGWCQNRAQCTNLFNDYNCSCLAGYKGKNCSIDINDCEKNPCQNNGSCIDLVNDYKCNCSLEWMGKNCNEEYDACSFKPCQNNGNCSSVKWNHDYNCLCVSGFDGDNCENNIDDCKNVTCENGSVCFDEVNSYNCACPIGMEGKNCLEDIDECKQSPCQHGGTCINSIGSYSCKCVFKIDTIDSNATLTFPTGYNGTNCENEINECDYQFPDQTDGVCLNGGTCIKRSGSYTCSCDNSGRDDGIYFNGRNCEVPFNYCTISTDRCQHGGTCITKPLIKFECKCQLGYEGDNCETNINDCISNPCQNNATCEDGVNLYACSCVNGTTGKNCATDIDECENNPCENNGQCKNLLNRYECNCTDTGFTGPSCSENINDCSNNSCQNNASCIDGVKSYSCRCFDGYKGEYCENDIDECSENPCVYSYACLQRSNQSLYGPSLSYFSSPKFSYANASGYKCLCNVGYEGKNCSIDINECLNKSCVYGSCIDNIGSATCDCYVGYEGELCEKDIDECSRNFCLHGSKCKNGLGIYNCTCLKGASKPWYGSKNCSVALTGCDHTPCLNNGTCNPLFDEENSEHYYKCSCMSGFMGKHCQDITTMSFNGSSFLETKALTTNRLRIEFQYQTTLENILISSFVLQNNNFITFQLKQGKPVLLNDTSIITELSTANNSTWQFIKFEFISKYLTVQISGNSCKFSICSIKLELAEEITGEVSFGKIHSSILSNNKYRSTLFVGCLQDISVNGDILLAINASKTANISMGCPRQQQCFQDSCNKRGRCIDLWLQKLCLCQRPYLGDFCEAESTAGTFAFNDILSFSEYNLTVIQNQLQTNLDLSFYFITRYGDSQIVYFGESDPTVNVASRSFFSLKLKGGSVFTELKRCNDSRYETPTKYNDGKKHFLAVKVSLETFTLNIDSFNITYSFNELCMLNVSTLTVGKKPEEPSSRKRRNTQLDENFKGILHDMILNNFSVLFNDNSSNVVRLPNALVPTIATNVQSGALTNDPCKVVKQCGNNSTCEYKEFEDYLCNCTAGFTGRNCTDVDFCYYINCSDSAKCGNTEDGYECYISVTFNLTSSILYKPNPHINNVENFTIYFRTREEQGYIFSTTDTATGSNFSVYLYNKNLQVNAGNMVGSISKNVTDGVWHIILLTWNETNAWIMLDDVKHVSISNSSINFTTLFSTNNFTVGEEFVGCMKNLSINGDYLPLLSDTSNSSHSQQYQLLQEVNIKLGCLSKNVCPSNKCLNQATCEDIWNKYQCNCLAGYTGEFCETDINECDNDPCMNGATCNDSVNSYLCICVKGFEGLRCENNTYDCPEMKPCSDNGNCNDLVDGYNCSCNNEYTGDRCEYKINETCTNTNCKDGNCTYFNYTDIFGKTFEVFNCTCNQGFRGDECEKETPFCDNINCSGRGNCSTNSERTGYICSCIHGYEGPGCENKTDFCQNSPCKNNGSCRNETDTYRCDCISGWHGQNCTEDINECTNRTEWCLNQGVCTNTPGSFICTCNGTGFEGIYCQCKGPCITEPCGNGTCIQNCTDQSYTCECTEGFEGNYCDQDINECDKQPCKNGGTCKNNVGSYVCNCPENYLGNNCNLEDPCSKNPCQNNGNCSYQLSPDRTHLLNSTCSCFLGYNGIACTAKVTSSETDIYIYIIIGVVLVILVIIIAAVTYFLITTRKKRATSGTYSPSRQEMTGSRVELGNVWKVPPTERLI